MSLKFRKMFLGFVLALLLVIGVSSTASFVLAEEMEDSTEEFLEAEDEDIEPPVEQTEEPEVIEESVTYDLSTMSLKSSELGEVEDGGTSENDLFEFEAFIKESDIKDGTKPFDKDDQAGNDSSDNNGIVRTFDTVTYPIKVTINPKKVDKLENIKLKISGTLENGITDNRVNAKFSVGGKEDLDTGVVSFEQIYTIEQTGNSVMIPIGVEVLGAKHGLSLKPNIKVEVISVDGKNIESDKVITKFDKLPSVTTSAKVNIKPVVNSGLTGRGIPYYPYAGITGNNDDLENVQAFSLSFGLQKLSGKSDIRGTTFPSGEINYRVELSGHVYWDGGPNKGKKVNYNFSKNDSPIYLLDHQPIQGGNERTGNENTLMEGKEYRYSYHQYYNAPLSKQLGKNTNRSVYDSGEWRVSEPTVENNKVIYQGSNKDYVIGSTFPEYRADGYTGAKIYGKDERIFSSNGFLFLMPNEYFIGGKNNPDGYANNAYYTAKVILESYIDEDGKEVKINGSGSRTVSERNNPAGSHSVQTTLKDYPSHKQLGTPNVGWSTVSKGDVSTILGQEVAYNASFGSDVVNYGGYDGIYRWNTDAFELTKEYAELGEKRVLQAGYYDNALNLIRNDTKNQKVYYGVQKFSDNSFESFTSKGRDDYTWYETYDEAKKNGSVGALMNRIKTPTGAKWQGGSHIPLHVKTKKIGSINENSTANIVVTNYYAYLDKERKTEIDVTKKRTYKTPSIWSEDGKLITKQTPVGSTINFETLAVLNAEVSSDISADKTTFYNSETINWKVDSSIVYPSTGIPESSDGSISVKQILPKGLDYIEGSGKYGKSEKSPKITKNSDGTTTLEWEILIQKDGVIDDITFSTSINPFAISGGGSSSSLTVKNIISSDLDTRPENLRTSSTTLTVLKVGMVGVYSKVDKQHGYKNSDFTFTFSPYTTIEDEMDVTGLTVLPLSGDKLGSNYNGSAKIKSITINAKREDDDGVDIYLNNKPIDSKDPHKIDTTKDGWYKYTGKEDLSKAVSVLFRVNGRMTNTDDIDININIQTSDNEFGDVYLGEAVLNSATDYKLSPVSNKVKYTIRADVELSLERIQIYTANAITNLPVKLRVDKEIIRDLSQNEVLKLVLYNKETNKKVFEKELTIESLAKENDLEVPAEFLEKDTNHSYEARIEGYDQNKIYVKKEADKIDTLGYTASEKVIEQNAENDGKLEYQGVVMTERILGQDITKYFETVTLPFNKLEPIKSGYGFETNQQLKYQNDLTFNQYVSPNMSVYLDEEVVDGSFYELKDGKAKVELVSENKATDTTITDTYKFPHVYVEDVNGTILSDEQYANEELETNHQIFEGGHKVYVPIWIDELGEYEYQLASEEPIGVNEIKVLINDTVDVQAYMFGHVGSETINEDEIIFSPVVPDQPKVPSYFTEEEIDWIRQIESN